jgi:hypothetical protein
MPSDSQNQTFAVFGQRSHLTVFDIAVPGREGPQNIWLRKMAA